MRKKRAYCRAKKSGKREDVTQYKQLQKDTQDHSKKVYNSYVNIMVSEGSSAKKLYYNLSQMGRGVRVVAFRSPNESRLTNLSFEGS